MRTRKVKFQSISSRICRCLNLAVYGEIQIDHFTTTFLKSVLVALSTGTIEPCPKVRMRAHENNICEMAEIFTQVQFSHTCTIVSDPLCPTLTCSSAHTKA